MTITITIRKIRPPEQCLKLERWQGPSQVEKYEIVLLPNVTN